MTSLLPLFIHGGSPSLLRVLSDNRIDGRQFVVSKEFTVDLFLQCYREAHQHIFGMLEVTTMVDFLMLRLRGALQEPWMENVFQLRQCVVAGKVSFAELRGVVKDLISIWESVRAFVRYTGPCHIKSESDRVSSCVILLTFCFRDVLSGCLTVYFFRVLILLIVVIDAWL